MIYNTPFYSDVIAQDNIALYANSRTIGKSDMLKLSMISLRYHLPGNMLRRYVPFIHFASLGVQGSNLYTWTSYSESDPESGKLSGTLQPVFTFCLNLTF